MVILSFFVIIFAEARINILWNTVFSSNIHFFIPYALSKTFLDGVIWFEEVPLKK